LSWIAAANEQTGGERRGGWVPTLALVIGLAIWLWPIGFGGRMPVGGDVTQFSIGLMEVLARAIRSGRLPLWNDLWGYGFPGVAESQMGVFYPPHFILYGLLPIELAYTTSLVVHVLWGGLGAAWAARRFGVSPWGAAVSGFAWAASGFFLIHLPHHWAYTTGSWMPWAWGLAWSLVRGTGSWRTPWLLALVLTLQVLPGHFQLAFCTQFGVLAIGLCSLGERLKGSRAAVKFAAILVAALVAVVPLAAMQLWPTYQLARLARQDRDFEYLSGFATTPVHLVSYVAPGLFHRSPLWRPVVWDPFHTSPEEHLAYVGLVPLFLALGAIAQGWRRDPGVRVLFILVLLTLILSLGPYVPGFSVWSQAPGFSFFRAPARWSVATGLALAVLAGMGFDSLATWRRPGRALAWFAVLSSMAPLLVVLGFELALASTEEPEWPRISAAFEHARELLPWKDDPSFQEVMAKARRPQNDLRVRATLAREGFAPVNGAGPRLSQERADIYKAELAQTAILIVGLLLLSAFADRRSLFPTALVVLTVVDLCALGRHRTIDVGPIRPLTAQSHVLDRLTAEPAGTRVVVTPPMGNLPMVANAAPVPAYRTLDLPALEQLTALTQWRLGRPPETDRVVISAMQAIGAGARIFDPILGADMARGRVDLRGSSLERIDDPVLAGWLYGVDWVASTRSGRATTFTIWKPKDPPARAWFIRPGNNRSLSDMAKSVGEPSRVLSALQNAKPLSEHSSRPESLEIFVEAEEPGVVLITQLDHPEWSGRWSGPDGERPASIVRAYGGWQAVEIPGKGPWTLHLEYLGRDVWTGLKASAIAWTIGVLAFLASWWRAAQTKAKAAKAPPEVEST
jgi:hypothetical protein